MSSSLPPVEPRCVPSEDAQVRRSPARILPCLSTVEQGLARVRQGLEELGPALDQAKLSMAALRSSDTASIAARRRTYVALLDLQKRSQELEGTLGSLRRNL